MNRFFTKALVLVALVASYACTTDATEDLATNIGNVETTLTVAIDDTRTQIGSEVDGKYPLFWSENDQISVNGITSKSIAINPANPAVASFTFEGTLNTPYELSYPATAVGKVKFAAEQTHTNGTFCDGAAVMYGYSADGMGTTLKHLTGVLKIGVTGSAAITKVQVSLNERPLAGEFALNFAEGTLGSAESASNVIKYSFGEGDALQLTEEVQYLYIAAPAGVLGDLGVTLYDSEGGVMNTTVKADSSKPLTAGMIRTFKNSISYAPNSEAIVISDYATLKAFAEKVQAATAEAPLTKDVLVVENINIPEGEAWTPLQWDSRSGDKYATFNGNGYSISGLNAPLFDSCVVNIKGLHLNVDIDAPITRTFGTSSNVHAHAGAFASRYYGNMSNCSAEGTIDIGLSCYFVNVGGIVGQSGAATYTNVVNRAAINVAKNNNMTHVGGLIGNVGYGYNAKIDGEVHITNCSNYGNIDCSTGVGSSGRNSYYGGILGSTYQSSPTYLTDCVNYGDIVTGTVKVKNLRLGGIVGTAEGCILKNIENRGDITTDSVCPENAGVGGCVGWIDGCSTVDGYHFDNIKNYGKLNVNTTTTRTTYVGGVVGRLYGREDIFLQVKDVVNYGAVTANYNSKTVPYFGGLFGTSYYADILNCSNEAAIEWGENAVCSSTSAVDLNMGGVSGWHRYGTVTNCGNNGKFTLKGVNKIHHHHIGGCFGQISAYGDKIDNVWNSGDIHLTSTLSPKRCRVGGIAGVIYYCMDMSNLSNSGNILYEAAKTSNQIFVGGISGYTYGNGSKITVFDKLSNSGTIDIKSGTASAASDIFIGGIHGDYYTKIIEGSSLKNAVNTGDINFYPGEGFTSVRVGGICGRIGQHSGVESCTQFSKLKAIGYARVGAIIGFPRSVTTTTDGVESTVYTIVKNCKVGGNIAVAEAQNDDGDIAPEWLMSESNYMDYIYLMDSTSWPSETDYDGCTYIKSL